MTIDTCQTALVVDRRSADNPLMRLLSTSDIDRQITWIVVFGVAGVGFYDFVRKTPPAGLLNLAPEFTLAIFLATCAVLAAVRSPLGDHMTRPQVRAALTALSLVAIMFSDPTYASLLVTIPLIDIRRRDDKPTRSLWMTGILTCVSVLLITEGTRRTTTEIEAMLGLAIALLVVVRLGDALRELDRRLHHEREYAIVNERNRIAEDIHDSLGHHLLASSVQLQKAKALREIDPERAGAASDYAADAIAEAISETRLIVDATRQPEGIDVPAAIHDLARRVAPNGVAVTIDVDDSYYLLDAEQRVAIYRVVQEALSNLVRHANANHAWIICEVAAASATVTVRDDGIGFDPDIVEHLGGIANMRRRIEDLDGSVSLSSNDSGTTISVTVPR